MNIKVKKELYASLAEGKSLMDKYEANPAEFTEQDSHILSHLQIEIVLLLRLYDGEYDKLDDDMLELADKIMLIEV